MRARLEEELDRLFQLPLADMVKERDLLVSRLRKDGAKEAAARIKALKRPAPGAWALNQVHFHEPALLERAEQRARDIRALHAEHGVDPARLRSALAAQRTATQAVVEAALGHCVRAGMASSAALQKKLALTIQGWLSGAGSEAPGRMTAELEASGFDAISEVGTPLPRPQPSGAVTQSSHAEPPALGAQEAKAPAIDAGALAAAQREVTKLERAERELDAQLARMRTQEQRTRREHEQLTQRIAEHERALSALRAEAEHKQDELARAESSRDQAEGAKQRAEEALGRARAKLSALTRGER